MLLRQNNDIYSVSFTQARWCLKCLKNNFSCFYMLLSVDNVISSGFGGYYCEQEKNHCKNSPCNNNATCLDLQNGFRCLCTSNFTGDKCDGMS